jgi:hypothetical protein
VQQVERGIHQLLSEEHDVRLWRANSSKKFPCELCSKLGHSSNSNPEVGSMSLRLHPVGYKSVELGTIAPYVQPTHPIRRLPWYHNRTVKNLVNLELLRSWLENCSQHHENTVCVPCKWLPHEAPFRLIDTTAMRVIETDDPLPYAALSYVSGKGTNRLTLGSNTFSLFTSCGGLHKG